VTTWNASVARWTLIFMLAGLAIIAGIVFTTLWLTSRTADVVQNMGPTRDLRVLASSLLLTLTNAESSQRGYLLSGDLKYLEPYEEAKPVLDSIMLQFAARVRQAPGQRPLATQLIEFVAAKRNEMAITVTLANAGDHDGAVTRLLSDDGRQYMVQISEILRGIVDRAEAANQRRTDQLSDDTGRLLLIVFGGGIVIILLGAAAAWTVARYTAKLIEAQHEVEALNAGLEQRVRDRTAALTHANEEIQRFAYIVTHDLRSPLVNIMGFTRELEVGVGALRKLIDDDVAETARDAGVVEAAKQAANEDLPEAVKFIRASTSKMDGLINAILKLSREGQRKLTPERIELDKLIDDAVGSVKHVATDAGARIEVGSRFPIIVSDRVALEQIIGNLLDNAVKYFQPGRPGIITIRVEEGRDRVELVVSDNGRGIAPNDHGRIFELYRRAGAQDRPGEGIGLTHVRAVVLRLGGNITVQSTLGEGATFKVDLPKVLTTKTD
jgi:signal transduction histidine kinase